MNATFDPSALRSEASLNRTVVGANPAFDLLSARAASTLVGGPGAEEVGRRVAALLATLKTGDPSTGLGMEPTSWRQAYLAHWHTISCVWLGGGTTARLGSRLAPAVARHLDHLGIGGLTVRVADQPALLPLIGAARTLTTATTAAVFDLGHSLVKRGVACYEQGRLTAIHLRAPISLDVQAMAEPEVINAVRSIVESTLDTTEPVDGVAISVAAYLRDGEPADRHGAYGALRSHHLARRPIWIHDGTAAGRAVPSRTRTAVVMLGTAIGVGFAPDPDTVAPAADDVAIG